MAKRELDNLDRDVMAAMALGYGCRYGHYKVDYPNTREEEPVVFTEDMGICLNCGKPFPLKGKRYRKLYCDDQCRSEYCSRRKYEKRLAQGAAV